MFTRSLIVIGIVSLFLVGSAHAQDTPDPGLIFQHSARAFFPAAMEFRVSLATQRENIVSGTLTLFQEGGYEQTLPFSAETDTAGGGLDTYDVIKAVILDGEDTPRPFVPINYRWEFLTKDDRLSEVTGELIFQDQRVPWQETGDPPFTFYWHNERLGVDILRENLLKVYDLLQSQTRLTPNFRFVIYESDLAFCEPFTDPETGVETLVTPDNPRYPCSAEAVQTYYAQHGIILIQRQDNIFMSLENQVSDEVVFRFYEPIWTKAPAWFTSGLTQLYRQVGDFAALITAQNASAQDQLLTLPQLEISPTAENQLLWNAQSYLLVLYLADAYGVDMPFELAVSLAEAPGFPQALEGMTEMSPAQIYRAWRIWLDSQESEVAVLWNPYLATTPTPTATRTDTPIPPTRTPTHTPTITLTPTSTSLIGRQPTLIASATRALASPTFKPTETNTPLPAGNLSRPTATPIPASDDDGNQLPCGASALIVPAVGIVLLSKRKKPA